MSTVAVNIHAIASSGAVTRRHAPRARCLRTMSSRMGSYLRVSAYFFYRLPIHTLIMTIGILKVVI